MQLSAQADINSKRRRSEGRVGFFISSVSNRPEMIAWQSVLGTESGGASNLTLSRVEHKGLVEATETVDLLFSCLQPGLELLLDGLKVPDVTGS